MPIHRIKKSLIETVPEEDQTQELSVKDMKSTVFNIVSELKETMNKELKEIWKIMS